MPSLEAVKLAVRIPNKLNLGAGNRVMPASDGWLNTDRWKHRPEIAQAADLQDFPWPWKDSIFDEVLAFDVLEHIGPTPMRVLEELWRICAPGAIVQIHAPWAGPQSDARHVWRDPTHIRPWHEEMLCYFDPTGKGGFWFDNYGQFYTQARFEQLEVRTDPPDNIYFRLKAIK